MHTDSQTDHDSMLDRTDRRGDAGAWTARGEDGVVVTAHYAATAVGVRILEAGGNAVDAAVAVSAALGVVEPAGSGLGGMGMMMVHLASKGRTFAIEGPARAPRRATAESLRDVSRRTGYTAVAVPSNPAILAHALSRYGTMPTAAVLAPAVELASRGVPLTPLQHTLTNRYRKSLGRGNAWAGFLADDKSAFPVGRVMKNPELADTLAHLGEAGFEDFYRGSVAARIAADMERNNGLVDAQDLEDIPLPKETEPTWGHFDGMDAAVLGPPGGGVTLLEMLHLLEEIEDRRGRLCPDSPAGALRFAAIIERARIDRIDMRLGRAGLSPARPEELASSEHVGRVACRVEDLCDAGETSHFNIMDRFGNAVAMTQSIERSFGAKVMTPGLGFLYNGYLKAFRVQNPRHPFYLRPGAAASSNASPTLLLKDGRPVIAIGSTGSERLLSGIFQTLVRLREGDPFAAVAAPRLHATPKREVLLEIDRFGSEVPRALEGAGYRIVPLPPWSFRMGGLHLAARLGGSDVAVAEPRRDGAACAPARTN